MKTGAVSWPRRRVLRACGAAGLAACGLAQAAGLAKVRERGRLVVGLYEDMPPFHAGGRGIDRTLAQLLAEGLGVELAPLPFHADENMADDLRNMVWKGHYLGHGPADVLLHVPVDKPLIDATPQVRLFAPYWRESVALARHRERVPAPQTLAQLAGLRVAVPGQTLAGWLLIGAEGGVLRDSLTTQWKDGAEAARALQRGDFDVAAGLRSELESVLGRDPRFAIEALQSPRAPGNGWAVGCAVKRDAEDLAAALQGVMNRLADDGTLAALFAENGVAWRKP